MIEMAAIQDHAYLKLCAELASCLSISLSSARKKVDLQAAQNGVKDLAERKVIAEQLLMEAKSKVNDGANSKLDNLLSALAEEENFMVED